MTWLEDWGALTSRQRTGLLVGGAVLALALAGFVLWLYRDPWVSLAERLEGDRLAELAQQLDHAKLTYRVGDDGRSLLVPASDLGRARTAAVASPAGPPPEVGLELFKETDFSTTDFAQRINYQRALQGELARTLSGVSGVKTVRVHVVLPEAGLFKRDGARATAAVNLTLRPGRTLGLAQVRGIQRLVAAAVPEIRPADVVVLDEYGTSLTRPVGDADAEVASSPLDLKRQMDQYIEVKLQRLLQDIAPDAIVSIAADADIDPRQLRVITEEPLAASAPAAGEHPAGVLVRERQSQRGVGSQANATATGSPDAGHPDSAEWENEYKVGRRLEQIMAAAGSIKRLSVAAALRGAPPGLSAAEVERLISHAAGIVKGRGDAVEVLLLPASPSNAASAPAEPAQTLNRAAEPTVAPVARTASNRQVLDALGLLVLGASLLLAALAWRRRYADRRGGAPAQSVEDIAERVRRWLAEGGGHAGG